MLLKSFLKDDPKEGYARLEETQKEIMPILNKLRWNIVEIVSLQDQKQYLLRLKLILNFHAPDYAESMLHRLIGVEYDNPSGIRGILTNLPKTLYHINQYYMPRRIIDALLAKYDSTNTMGRFKFDSKLLLSILQHRDQKMLTPKRLQIIIKYSHDNLYNDDKFFESLVKHSSLNEEILNQIITLINTYPPQAKLNKTKLIIKHAPTKFIKKELVETVLSHQNQAQNEQFLLVLIKRLQEFDDDKDEETLLRLTDIINLKFITKDIILQLGKKIKIIDEFYLLYKINSMLPIADRADFNEVYCKLPLKLRILSYNRDLALTAAIKNKEGFEAEFRYMKHALEKVFSQVQQPPSAGKEPLFVPQIYLHILSFLHGSFVELVKKDGPNGTTVVEESCAEKRLFFLSSIISKRQETQEPEKTTKKHLPPVLVIL